MFLTPHGCAADRLAAMRCSFFPLRVFGLFATCLEFWSLWKAMLPFLHHHKKKKNCIPVLLKRRREYSNGATRNVASRQAGPKQKVATAVAIRHFDFKSVSERKDARQDAEPGPCAAAGCGSLPAERSSVCGWRPAPAAARRHPVPHG